MAMIGKKGMIFTIVAILLVGVLIASSVILAKTTYKEKSFIAITRVNSMNDFILSLHQDATRNLMISGYRAVISLQRYVAINGTFISGFDSKFMELVVNGTINGEVQDLMANATVTDWAERINIEANKLNININVTPKSVQVYHTSPWIIMIEFNATINVSDFNSLASWNYNKTFRKPIVVLNFEDPLYTVKSYNKVTNLIIAANNLSFVDPITNDTTVLYTHLNNSYYIESNYSPSFLMRFEGNLSASPYGIESLVNIVDFSRQSIPIFDKSVIDYEYFDDSYDESDDKCNFEGMPSWFRIDANRRESYNLSGKGEDC